MKNLTTIILFAVFATTNAYSQELTAVNTPQTSNSETNAYNSSPEKVIIQEKGFIVNGKKVGKWISKSSNGKMLFQSCKNENKNSYFVSDISEIKKDWFVNQTKIGICGATSTPRWLMEDVQTSIHNLFN